VFVQIMAAQSPSLMKFNYEIHSATNYAVQARGPEGGYNDLRMARIAGNQKMRDMSYDCLEPGCEYGCCCYVLCFYRSLHAPYAGWERYIL